MKYVKNFGFTEEAGMLKNSAKDFFQKKLPVNELHKLVADEADYYREPKAKWDKGLWGEMVALGWPAVSIDEAQDGIGMPLIAAAGLVEEVGKAACPSPLLSTLQSTYALSACQTEPANKLLTDVAGGTAVSLAVCSQDAPWEHDASDVEVIENETGFVLNGTAWFVQDAQKANRFIVKAANKSAAGKKGLGLFVVDASTQGVKIIADHIVDLTRDQAHIVFDHVEIDTSAELSPLGKATDVLLQAEPALLTLLTADMVGAAEWQLQTTVEYASTRVQFDKPIAFFQAVKHPLVDLMAMIDKSRSLVYTAACAFDNPVEEPGKAALYAHMAKASASDMANYGSRKSIQLHGGIGFTWECFVHLYVKRQKHSQVMLGSANFHREKMASLVLDSAA